MWQTSIRTLTPEAAKPNIPDYEEAGGILEHQDAAEVSSCGSPGKQSFPQGGVAEAGSWHVTLLVLL